ncbi:MAG: hypothetical protein ACP5M0_03265 [Desulfomonilaceae bacterium]
MKLVVTIDVEEEGLFQGKYDPFHAETTNVSSLELLDDVFLKWNIHPTLLITYHVAKQRRLQEFLMGLAERWGGEIGAHLHHWNTPPIRPLPFPDPVPSECMPPELLREKLDSLFEAFEPMHIVPRSFRMGRFSFGPKMCALLEDSPIVVDSSVAPLRTQYGGPDHLTAPIDPYMPDPLDVTSFGRSRLLEVPITIVPIHPHVGRLLEKVRRRWPRTHAAVGWTASRLCSLPVQPAWTGIARLKIASALHLRRGGQVLTLFFHSSELSPAHNPLHPTVRHVQSFIKKLDTFFQWLNQRGQVECITLCQLREIWPFSVTAPRTPDQSQCDQKARGFSETR